MNHLIAAADIGRRLVAGTRPIRTVARGDRPGPEAIVPGRSGRFGGAATVRPPRIGGRRLGG